jgi:hypothetical protein
VEPVGKDESTSGNAGAKGCVGKADMRKKFGSPFWSKQADTGRSETGS